VDKPWGAVDPNSTHQRWSRWTFTVAAHPDKLPTQAECIDAFRRYVAVLFQSRIGRVKLEIASNAWRGGMFNGEYPEVWLYVFTVEVEGPPVHDVMYRDWVRREFGGVFVLKGFGPSARLHQMETSLLAGSAQNGTPSRQLLVLPTVKLLAES
jgi:hypothetical protein